jgi:hypothetical protein
MRFDWKLFWVVLAAALVGAVGVLPMALEIIEAVKPSLPASQRAVPPLPLLILAAVAQNLLLFGAAAAIGVRLTPKVGTGAPLIQRWLRREPVPHAWQGLRVPFGIGLAVGLVLVALDVFVFLPLVPAALQISDHIPLWKRLLGGFLYGGITEEILMRWGLLTLAAWLLARVWRTSEGHPTSGAWWTANVMIALLFGLGHLPATSLLVPLTTAVVVRALVLNGIAGLTFGYLFWRRGLEAAMAAHLAAHIGLQVVGPAVGRLVAGS